MFCCASWNFYEIRRHGILKLLLFSPLSTESSQGVCAQSLDHAEEKPFIFEIDVGSKQREIGMIFTNTDARDATEIDIACSLKPSREHFVS